MQYVLLIAAAIAAHGGSALIQAGMKRLLPELAKILDDPEVEAMKKVLSQEELINRVLERLTKVALQSTKR